MWVNVTVRAGPDDVELQCIAQASQLPPSLDEVPGFTEGRLPNVSEYKRELMVYPADGTYSVPDHGFRLRGAWGNGVGIIEADKVDVCRPQPVAFAVG